MKQLLWGVVLLVLVAACSPAASILFVATGPNVHGLSGANENPVNASLATGTAFVTWDTVTNMMTVDVMFSNLTEPNTAAHIHCCIAPPGNTGVATTTPTFTGFPTGATSGTYLHTFDMLDPTSYNASFLNNATNMGDPNTAAMTLLSGMQAGQAYLNIHSSEYPGGEIRGFLQVVPEPGTVALFGAGLALIALRRKMATSAGRRR